MPELSPLAVARRRFIYDGLLRGNRKWLYLGGAAWGAHFMARAFRTGDPEPVYTEDLKPGERVIVVHQPTAKRNKR